MVTRSTGEEFERLVGIMARLRRECPWDRSQTHASLRTYLLEEAHELLEALDRQEELAICDELGDVMLQVVFHAEIGRENDAFDISDVLRGINEKLVRRHPHVFGCEDAGDAEAVHRRWEDIKRNIEDRPSSLSGVPPQLPALLRAGRVLGKMLQNGFDPFAEVDVYALTRRELTTLAEAVEREDPHAAAQAVGRLGICLVRLAREVGVEPEHELRSAVSRLADAFQREESNPDSAENINSMDAEEKADLCKRLLDALEEDA